ncbi:hypothetical protein [Undibacter mobilis]|uniref:Uncharacterized protein n=1 Tax=Undibacter mobilis TaxID=2292256 RepID=A0A371B804_9BRAD|nr:hypothetical protein [Undibacter mobilis]RDV03726.1 hypothetical protein DXH78_03475 [Undibacter mobilis]
MTNDRNHGFRQNAHKHDALDDVLRRVTAPRPVDAAAVARVLKRIQPPLPRQKMSLWRLPGALLDWEFSPSWPRMTALACSAVLGFYVGIIGLDRPFDQLDQTMIGNADSGFFVFDPEPLTGARP